MDKGYCFAETLVPISLELDLDPWMLWQTGGPQQDGESQARRRVCETQSAIKSLESKSLLGLPAAGEPRFSTHHREGTETNGHEDDVSRFRYWNS